LLLLIGVDLSACSAMFIFTVDLVALEVINLPKPQFSYADHLGKFLSLASGRVGI
jgi:hypothetical protein